MASIIDIIYYKYKNRNSLKYIDKISKECSGYDNDEEKLTCIKKIHPNTFDITLTSNISLSEQQKKDFENIIYQKCTIKLLNKDEFIHCSVKELKTFVMKNEDCINFTLI
jgi:hypothetical protein